MLTKIEVENELGFQHYTKTEIVQLGMKPINNHNMNYLVYEENDKVFFFDKISEDLYQLFLITSRLSFYL